ncbi:sugar phosphate isomerase/epimerase [Paenibacillus sp. IB182496]|uniref:Sugar phosphate isomerase/epimerase n=1 Tax=Paenibacillus sabuli TaxID=2772509 RepID=A0A927BNR3_9BACL|nr:sugar phosphate isomerase/epimerase family protein [Paenibacillus sabuli]MBD2843928.1 sugar phosphate isomerase/epimerase [Paenibacillus sabuli]
MKFGWCATLERAGQLAAHGLDYIECPLSGLQLETAEGLEARIAQAAASPLPVRAANLFAPAGMLLVGEQQDLARIRAYAERVGEAAQRIGLQVVVLGSGGARRVPDGWDKQRAEAQMVDVLAEIDRAWRGSGLTLALEPLRRKEANLINSVAEGVALVRQVDSPIIRVLADFFHMDEDDEPLETLRAHKDWIAHIHIADTGRRAPGTGSYPYERFAALLREIGYTGMVSAECAWPETDEELAASVAFMRRMAEPAGV